MSLVNVRKLKIGRLSDDCRTRVVTSLMAITYQSDTRTISCVTSPQLAKACRAFYLPKRRGEEQGFIILTQRCGDVMIAKWYLLLKCISSSLQFDWLGQISVVITLLSKFFTFFTNCNNWRWYSSNLYRIICRNKPKR